MVAARPVRNTATRDRHRKIIARDEPPCGICGDPINYALPSDEPMSYVVDHIVPYSVSNDDSLANKQAAHKVCNGIKSATMPDPEGIQWMHVDPATW